MKVKTKRVRTARTISFSTDVLARMDDAIVAEAKRRGWRKLSRNNFQSTLLEMWEQAHERVPEEAAGKNPGP